MDWTLAFLIRRIDSSGQSHSGFRLVNDNALALPRQSARFLSRSMPSRESVQTSVAKKCPLKREPIRLRLILSGLLKPRQRHQKAQKIASLGFLEILVLDPTTSWRRVP